MNPILNSVMFGIFGGLVRGFVGILKYMEKNKNQKEFKVWYLVFSLFVAALVGGFAGALADKDWKLAFLAGYTGTDFIEGLYKIRMKQGIEI